MIFITRFTRFYELHERRISSFALLVGFIVDNLTLRRVDLLFDNLVILFYLFLSGVSIILLNVFEERGGGELRSFLRKIHTFLPTVIQYAFGGLFSAFVVFYSRSASLAASWPFVLILVFLLIGNELFRAYYLRLVFQVGIYFVALFSFFIFSVPTLLGVMGSWVFLLSGLVSLVVIAFLFRGFSIFVPVRYAESKEVLKKVVIALFLFINLLYFTNMIPPIPLALKEAGAFHFVERSVQGYKVVDEERWWYERFLPQKTLHVRQGDPVYVFSAVFAPTRLETSIVHHWQYYDEEQKRWISSNRVALPIFGGRGGGYRIYSFKRDIVPGLWRVDVETTNGLNVGRLEFRVKRPTEKIIFEEKLL